MSSPSPASGARSLLTVVYRFVKKMGNIFKTHIWGIFAICYLHITCYLYILHISVMKWGEINWDALHHIAFRNGATLCWGWSNNCLAHSLTKWQNSDHVALSQLPCAHHLADVCPCQLTVSLKCCSWAWVFFPQWNVEGLLRDEFSHHASQNILKEHLLFCIYSRWWCANFFIEAVQWWKNMEWMKYHQH